MNTKDKSLSISFLVFTFFIVLIAGFLYVMNKKSDTFLLANIISASEYTYDIDSTVFLSEIPTLNIGVIADSENNLSAYQDITQFVASHLQSNKIGKVILKTFETAMDLSYAMDNEEVDIFIGDPYVSFILSETTYADLALVQEQFGLQSGSASLFTRADSPLETLDDLLGRTIAFEHFFSASGFAFVQSHLQEQGYKLVHTHGPYEPISSDTIGYYFAGNSAKVLRDVITGKAAAGSSHDILIQNYFASMKTPVKSIYTSEEFTHDLVMIASHVTLEIRNDIVNVLSNMHNEALGSDILSRIDSSTSFQNQSIQTNVFQPMKRVYNIFRKNTVDL